MKKLNEIIPELSKYNFTCGIQLYFGCDHGVDGVATLLILSLNLLKRALPVTPA